MRHKPECDALTERVPEPPCICPEITACEQRVNALWTSTMPEGAA